MKDILLRARRGDGEAFVALIEAHKTSLSMIARSYFRNGMDAEDAVAQTVLDAWEKLSTLKSPAYFKTWLTKILINNCNDILRRRAKLVVLDTIPERDGAEDDHSGLFFDELMETLSQPVRTVVQLYYGEGFNTREIAELLGIPAGTVTARLKRGRDALAARMGGEDT